VLELTESIHDGLRREVREETGLGVEPITLTGVYKNITRGSSRSSSAARSRAVT
jgi:8-oxo-dGTP diphosphatase